MILVEDLTFRYRRDSDLLYGGLTRQFVPGSLTAVTGPSGSGKSTLLYLLGLLLTPTSGRVLLDGTDASGTDDANRSGLRASKLGFVFQDAALDPTRSVLDNVTEGALYAGLPRRAAQEQGRELLERFGVGIRADHLPGQISGGQAQRVALCRAMLNRPSVLLADEPTGNLDSRTSAEIMALFDELHAQGQTVVVVTHEPDIAAHCRRSIRVNDGRIVEDIATSGIRQPGSARAN